MKKLLFLIVLGALAYGTFKYLESVKNETSKKQDVLKPSEAVATVRFLVSSIAVTLASGTALPC